MLRTNAGRTVGGDGIIPNRMAMQFIEPAQILHQTGLDLFRRERQAVKINILVLIIRPKTDYVSLVCGDVDKLELTIKPSQRGVTLALLGPCLDRETEMTLRPKSNERIGCAM